MLPDATIEKAKVFAIQGTDTVTTFTDADGFYAISDYLQILIQCSQQRITLIQPALKVLL